MELLCGPTIPFVVVLRTGQHRHAEGNAVDNPHASCTQTVVVKERRPRLVPRDSIRRDSAQSTTKNITSNGTGWDAGGTLIPIHTATTSLGLSYYYFAATSTSYNYSTVAAGVQTIGQTPAQVHSSGWFSGVTVLLNF
jgi:hypothetical protein